MHVESLSGPVTTDACEHNDEWLFSLLVLWGLSGSLHPWQAGSLKGANRGDVQLPVVTHSASHPTHLRT